MNRFSSQGEFDAKGSGIQLWDLDLTAGDLLWIRWWPGLHIFMGYTGVKPRRETGWYAASRIVTASFEGYALTWSIWPADHEVVIVAKMSS